MKEKIKTVIIILEIISSILFFGFLDEIYFHNYARNYSTSINQEKSNLNLGDWGEEIRLNVPAWLTDGCVGDVNNDGYKDIICVHRDRNFIGIFLWNNTLQFWNPIVKLRGIVYSWGVFIGDANNDGFNDIVASSGHPRHELVIFLWNATIQDWDPEITRPAGNSPEELFIGDANNDGYNDIVVANYRSHDISILIWNNTINNWNPQIIKRSGRGAYKVFIGDANNDGFNDIVVANRFHGNGDPHPGRGRLVIFPWNSSTGDWDERIIKKVGKWPTQVYVGDANNDGFNDIAVSNEESRDILIFLWNNTINDWEDPIRKVVGKSAYCVCIGDADNDGLNDVVAGNTMIGSVRIFIWNKTSNNWNTPIIRYIDNGPFQVFIDDANNDGYNDIITINFSGDISILPWITEIDVTPPIITIEYQDGDGTDGNPGKWNVFAYDDESGINEDTINILIDGEFARDTLGDYNVPNTLGMHTISVEVENNDGYLGSESDSVTIIDDDVTPPEILINYIGSGFDSDPGYFEWNIFDLDSGINDINISITYESTEGLDDYTMYLEGTEMGSWDLPPNLGIYTIRIFARDNDDDRTLIVDSLTTELTRDQEIVDDDVVSPELSNLIIIPSIFEINITFNAIDESGIGDISTFINGELIEPITQIQYGSTYSFIFENEWLFQSGTSEVIIQVEDGDDDRPNDALASSITGTFESVLYMMYEYVDWQLEELKNYVDENLCLRVVRSLNRKLTQAQDHLYEAFNYFEDGSITCALFHDYLAKLFIRFAEHRTEIFNKKGVIEDYHAEYIIDSLHEIRNNIVLLMGASTGEEQAYEIALIEVELLNLKDFIEDEIPCCVGRCLSAKISCSAKLLELALFKISKGYIDCILEYTQCKLEHAITKINFLLEKGKIPEDVANYLIEKISSIIEDIEAIKNN